MCYAWSRWYETHTNEAWCNRQYARDPEGFFSDVLGVRLWDKQREIVAACVDHPFVAVRSGRKVGKTALGSGIALWRYAMSDTSQILITATTADQVRAVIWRELSYRVLHAKHKIPGTLADVPGTGLRYNFRVLRGFSVRDREAAAGVSGADLYYWVDEASGVNDEIFATIDGNLAGTDDTSGGVLMTSNPTQNEGAFFRAFHTETELWKTFTVSSEDTPNVTGKGPPVRGLATRRWIQRQEQKYGRDSAEFIVHVLGRHATHDDGKAFSYALVERAQTQWHDTPAHGRLYVGIDPASDGPTSKDQTVFAIRRGLKIIALRVYKRLSAEAHATHLLALLDEFRDPPHEVPIVAFDTSGDVGSKVLPYLREREGMGAKARYQLFPVRSSDKAVRYVKEYRSRAAELVANLRVWMRSGGTIPPDEHLAQELRAWEFTRLSADDAKMKVDKEAVRKIIGRSPDRCDAVALACWEPVSTELQQRPVPVPSPAPPRFGEGRTAGRINPFDVLWSH